MMPNSTATLEVANLERVKPGRGLLLRGQLVDSDVAVTVRRVEPIGLLDVADGDWWRCLSATGQTGWTCFAEQYHPTLGDAELALMSKAHRWRAGGKEWNAPALWMAKVLTDFMPPFNAIVAEWVDGRTLEQLGWGERRGLLPRLLRPLLQACAATSHGDLKPSNVVLHPNGAQFSLIDPAAWVKVAASRPRGPRSESFLVEATPRYAPLLVAEPAEALVMDVIAAGVMYFESLWSGAHPMGADGSWKPGWAGGYGGQLFGEGISRTSIQFSDEALSVWRTQPWRIPPAAEASADTDPTAVELALAYSLLEAVNPTEISIDWPRIWAALDAVLDARRA